MFRKNWFAVLLASVLFSASAVSGFAQTAPVRGKVELKKADGTTVPVADAVIDVFRTDIKAKLPTGKTNKKGEFSFAGLPFVGRYILSVSAPNINPQVSPEIRAGVENIVIIVTEGNGKRLTEEEVREPAKTIPTDGLRQTSTTTTVTKQGELSEKDKKAQEEYQKLVAENQAKNKNVENINATVNRALKEGDREFKSKNYDAAIALYDEGINADPDFAGTAVVLLNNKALVLLNRALNLGNQNAKAEPAVKAAAMVKVKKDYEDAIVASERSLLLLKNSTETDPNVQKGFAIAKNDALANRKEAYRLMIRSGADRTKGKEALAAFQEYIDASSDANVKTSAQAALVNVLMDAQESDLAITEAEKILSKDPNNIDALAVAGLSLVNVGYVNNDKAKMQQGANYLQKYTEVAPANHQYVNDAKGLIESLKKDQNVTPQKGGKKKS